MDNFGVVSDDNRRGVRSVSIQGTQFLGDGLARIGKKCFHPNTGLGAN
jgi:hypothetical protein